MGAAPQLYDIIVLLCGGASLCISFLSLVVGLRVGDRKKWLLLTLLGLLEGLYCIFLFYYFAAPDPQSSLIWSGGFCIFMPFMTYAYVALCHNQIRDIPPWFKPFPMIALSGSVGFTILMCSDLFLETHLVLRELQINPGTMHRKLMHFNVFGQSWFGVVSALYYTSAFLLIRDFFRGHRETLPIIIGTVCYFVALSSDFNVLFGLYDFYFIQHLGFFAMVIGFNFHFAHDYIRSVRELRSAHEELQVHRERMIQDEKLRLMGKMSAFIAHEINSPLNVITLSSDVARGLAAKQTDVQRYLDKISKSAWQIQKIIKGLSGFARSDAREVAETVNMRALVQEAVDFCSIRDRLTQIPIHLEIDEHLTLKCFPTQLVQCLVNLINNAIYAVEQKDDRWIRIEAQVKDGQIEIAVFDSGDPISPEKAAQILQSFYTTKGRGVGTGLGLTIVQMLVARHKGQFFIDSQAASACFRIRLGT